MKAPLSEGIVAISQKGRDKGHSFMILYQLDADFVLIADGSTRKLQKPKKKRRRHLISTSKEFPQLAEKYREGKLTDSDLRKALDGLSATNPDAADKEGSVFGQK